MAFRYKYCKLSLNSTQMVRHFIFVIVFFFASLKLFSQNDSLISSTVGGNNQFAFDFFKLSTERNSSNFIFYPEGISSLAASLYIGMQGKVAAETAKAFYFYYKDNEFLNAFDFILSTNNGTKSSEYYYKTSNYCILPSKYPLNKTYQNQSENVFNTKFDSLDYSVSVMENQKKLDSLLSTGLSSFHTPFFTFEELPADSKMITCNISVLNADWKNKFSLKTTKPDYFHLSEKDSVSTDFMNQVMLVRFGQTKEMELIEIPFGIQNSLIVVIPKKIDGIFELEAHISETNLNFWLQGAHKISTNVCLPKIEIQQNNDIKENYLSEKAPILFSQYPNLSAISSKIISISLIKQFGFLRMDENGIYSDKSPNTDIVNILETSVGSEIFCANRPYILIVRDSATGSVLLMGRIMNPTLNH